MQGEYCVIGSYDSDSVFFIMIEGRLGMFAKVKRFQNVLNLRYLGREVVGAHLALCAEENQVLFGRPIVECMGGGRGD